MKDKEKKKTSVSKSGKGIVVRRPEKEQEVEILPFSVKSNQAEIYEEQEFDLDRVEKEMVKIDEQKTFLERFLGKDSEDPRQLKEAAEKAEQRRRLREELSTIAVQGEKVKAELLDMKTRLLEKKMLAHPDVQRLSLEIKLRDLRIQKLQKELREAELQKQINDLKNSSQKTEEEEAVEGSYDLKDLETLKEKPTSEDDTS